MKKYEQCAKICYIFGIWNSENVTQKFMAECTFLRLQTGSKTFVI